MNEPTTKTVVICRAAPYMFQGDEHGKTKWGKTEVDTELPHQVD